MHFERRRAEVGGARDEDRKGKESVLMSSPVFEHLPPSALQWWCCEQYLVHAALIPFQKDSLNAMASGEKRGHGSFPNRSMSRLHSAAVTLDQLNGHCCHPEDAV